MSRSGERYLSYKTEVHLQVNARLQVSVPNPRVHALGWAGFSPNEYAKWDGHTGTNRVAFLLLAWYVDRSPANCKGPAGATYEASYSENKALTRKL